LKSVVRLPSVAFSSAPNGSENVNATIKDRWRPGQNNEGKTIPVILENGGYVSINGEYSTATGWYNESDATVVPGDYLRFRNLMLEYQLPAQWLEKVVVGGRSLGNVSLKFQAQNLFVIANKRLKGYDPRQSIIR
ncbi:MAG: hypothetical protein ACLUDU_13310, partial [Butyricimonas faecihominis]